MLKSLIFLVGCALIVILANVFVIGQDKSKDQIKNSKIDYQEFLMNANKAEEHRSTRRLLEKDFIEKSKEKGVVILDARSKDKYDLLHIKGAVNLPFADIATASLQQLIPDKETTILIYCNNNFQGNEVAFMSKKAGASLNISTYISLYTYGYRNIYELGPLLDVKNTKLELVSSKTVNK